jgi:YebC/PmpR family DNA-binding regulatory protein
MSGHSKWASIKHKKAITDARRGASFTKLANLISIAAKQGGADPEMNFSLRLAVTKAKAANMPSANIERAIKKGAGGGDGVAYEEITYEGYGPAGVAIIIETATDNRNRTGTEVRTAVTKHGGSMGTAGSVLFQFDHKGVIEINQKPGEDVDEAMLTIIEAGADDIENMEGSFIVYTAANQLDAVRKQLIASGYEVTKAELQYIPQTTVEVDAKAAGQLMRITDTLEDLDDVTNVYANFEIPDDVMAQLNV